MELKINLKRKLGGFVFLIFSGLSVVVILPAQSDLSSAPHAESPTLGCTLRPSSNSSTCADPYLTRDIMANQAIRAYWSDNPMERDALYAQQGKADFCNEFNEQRLIVSEKYRVIKASFQVKEVQLHNIRIAYFERFTQESELNDLANLAHDLNTFFPDVAISYINYTTSSSSSSVSPIGFLMGDKVNLSIMNETQEVRLGR